MKADGILCLVVASVTIFCFGAGMRWFRRANRRTLPKVCLTLSALACAALQLTVIAGAHAVQLPCRVLGLGLYALAHLVYWWSLASHGGKRPDFALVRLKPTFLTQSGPYRLVRHPIYTSYLLVWLAGPVVAGQPWLLLTTLWMLAWHYYAARQEETLFAQTALAGDYEVYRQRTGMFFPRLR